jgi:hypothetical protein
MINNDNIINLLSLLFILINIGSNNYVESISYGGIYMCCTCCYLLVWGYYHHYYIIMMMIFMMIIITLIGDCKIDN